jgi:sensor histidine kinase regulating citrate/malate metabolism
MYFIRVSQHFRQLTVSQEQYMQTELDHFMQYKQNQEETIRFRHDIRNNLLCVNGLLESGKTDEARVYLKDLLRATDALRKQFVSGDEMLDCIIGVKTGIMVKKEIRFQLEGLLAGGLQWKVMDICTVFANAFDNAIEACQQLPPEKRQITMRIKSTDQFWFLTIQNPVKDDVDTKQLFQKNGGFTSKADAKLHGIGTYNMKRVVESYGGIMKAQCRNDVFSLEIMIDKAK